MKVLITQHYFRSSEASYPPEVVAALPEGLLGKVDEGFKQEVIEVDRLIEAVAYDCGLGVEDITEGEIDSGWVETEHGIFISGPEQCVSYVILEGASVPLQLFH
ncbi:hypothetical protein D3C75_503370 [compost metagenome]